MKPQVAPMSPEGMRQAFIRELKSMGIEEGRNGESLDSLDYHSVLNLVTIERIKRDYE
ncbi:hypothetical protein HMPREF1210_01171 [Paenisporosarcina sp. HGH0030]|uniref:hypothetical protein n=1 Tax=Paenisporosarcina sp. HGH0030 TaxID=1078085 RepID=UPI00034EB4DA|nr:hypothetical protein [Paenisporosarcina sp. HGH0030]EPD52791.1 hypothetical protein HMPREF1210_01171 [Paenisporosarcina sp. HGH0030]